jgi:hypothetical protein
MYGGVTGSHFSFKVLCNTDFYLFIYLCFKFISGLSYIRDKTKDGLGPHLGQL